MLQAVTEAPWTVALRSALIPEPSAGEVRIRVERVGICGSDIHIYHDTHPRARLPLVQGHEASAIVDCVGPNSPSHWNPGERVAIDPLMGCGTCYACRIGRSNACANATILGAHAVGLLTEFAVVPERTLHRASELSADEAALVEPLSVGVQAISRAGIRPGERVLILGAGPIGACAAIAALDRGARVMMADRLPFRLQVMQSLGVELTTLATGAGLEDEARAWTRGDGPAVVIDAVGQPDVIRTCCSLVAPAGRVVIVGLSDREVSLPIVDFTYKEMSILGSRASGGRFRETIEVAARCRAQLNALVTHRFSLGHVGSALDLAGNHPEQTQKIIFEVTD
jgi:L-gulonate 5-dehydrogenase